MNKLPLHKRVQIINLLVEGNSLRSTSRIADVSINTVTKLLVDVGRACEQFHHDTVIAVPSKRIQCDEIWSFVGCKDKNATIEQKEAGNGDAWTWVAIDADTKLVVSWYVGDRGMESALEFMQDIQSRISEQRVQLTSDGWNIYLDAVGSVFGSQIDYAQLMKIYGGGGSSSNSNTEKKYSPARLKSINKIVVSGNPDVEHISTSFVERQNLTMRMHMRRFTRLTNAFSKKLENHCHAIALHFVYYNFVKQHKSLRITPAIAAGLTKRFMSIEDIANLVPDESSKTRGQYKKKIV
ncbi:IS1 family transposase [Ferruginibacter lapsinanis]|uniref:IS1 family transposase n=1 Tax=Ferruginibacter lapsinanis TaxID=563172 RepID=UPI001E2D456E|nr:IS1 family transposase [Ferruginibacter lapsinanis]UEG49263.1 IS1 family transposase [Ferruginibacter lapsinanis]